MKKVLVYLIIGFTLLSCKGQNQEFNDYISNFQEIELPFLIDRRDSINRFYVREVLQSIPLNYIKKFVCEDSMHCDYDPSEYSYNYRYKYKINSNIIVAFVSKGKDKGKTCYDFDLGETLLIVYSKDGKIIDEKSIAKDNDCWLSSIWVTEDSIRVQQMRVIDPSQYKNKYEGLDCEIETKIYQIGDDGYINLMKTETIKKGVLMWDKNIYDYILKQ
ncbi:MAG TPA: hypothetical protein PLK25_00590 [Bacteroidales bacterium]|jgi:hypothetical protein|nr:hypothetical protein [Bacteroidales bacterium]HRC78194.1 hypothetical protein [Bacteroidales bacterium]